jgi:hypothetical protein
LIEPGSAWRKRRELKQKNPSEIGASQWAELDAFLYGIAHWKRLGLFDKRLGDVVKQRLRHQETLGANATLTVIEGQACDASIEAKTWFRRAKAQNESKE